MRKPNDPTAVLACVFYLKRRRFMYSVRGGVDVYAPKGKNFFVTSIHPDGHPVGRFFGDEGDYGVAWSWLTEEEPKCAECGHSRVPEGFTYIPHKPR